MPEIKNIDYLNAFDRYNDTTSTKFANNILAYCDSNKIKVGTVLDLSCKTGTFLNIFHSSKAKTFGCDTSKDMIDYASNKYPKISFKQAKSVSEFPFKNSFDIIACNYDYINQFPNISSFSALFKPTFKHLSNKGIFVISMNSPRTLKTSGLTFKSDYGVDALTEINAISSSEANVKTTFYDNSGNYSVKSTSQLPLYIYSPDEIIGELKKSGFKTCNIVSSELFDNENQEEKGRYYILATKK